MRVFEERIGRIASLTQIDVSPGSSGTEQTSSDVLTTENTEQNAIVH
jgi:hypothetical protein